MMVEAGGSEAKAVHVMVIELDDDNSGRWFTTMPFRSQKHPTQTAGAGPSANADNVTSSEMISTKQRKH